jgi:hypothetical protein
MIAVSNLRRKSAYAGIAVCKTRCTTEVPTPTVRPILSMPMPSALSSRMRASTEVFTLRRSVLGLSIRSEIAASYPH